MMLSSRSFLPEVRSLFPSRQNINASLRRRECGKRSIESYSPDNVEAIACFDASSINSGNFSIS
uniref:Uncharacterized protein n=1 Tax=Arundo donax TaxID=35708 RepID=A0A0A9FPU8_ARUDO